MRPLNVGAGRRWAYGCRVRFATTQSSGGSVMRYSLRTLAVGMIVLVALAFQARGEDRTAEQIVADYNAAKPQLPDQEKLKSDPEYRKEFSKQYTAGLEKQAEFARE